MSMTLVEMLALEGNGAVQVDASPDKVPPIVMLAGPIKVWWSEWGSDRHNSYTQWRGAVETALIKAGCAVYSPHKAIRGRWNEALQAINDAAIRAANFMVVLTPPDCPADGTAHEVELASDYRTPIIYAPPGDDDDILRLLREINHLG